MDVGVFRFINETLSNPIFDKIMPFASGNKFFFPVLAIVGMLLLWKGGKRGWICAMMAALILWPGDSYICNTIKHAIGRARPFVALQDARQPMSQGKNRARPLESRPNPQTGISAPQDDTTQPRAMD